MKSNIIENLENHWSQLFPELRLDLQTTQVNDVSYEVFFISECNEFEITKSWVKIINFIAVEFQAELNSTFERWNIYVVFISNDKISKELRYKIENDTFSSRKIVIDDGMTKEDIIKHYITKEDFTTKFKLTKVSQAKNSINEYLYENKNLEKNGIDLSVFSNIELSKTENIDDIIAEKFQPNPELEKLIKKFNLVGRKDNNTREALNNLIQKWSNT